MRKTSIVLFIVLAALSSTWSCKPILKLAIGIHLPRPEKYDVAKAYYHKLGYDSSKVLMLKEENWLKMIELNFLKVPGYFLFDKGGHLLVHYDIGAENKNCVASIEKSLEMIKPNWAFEKVEGKRLEQLSGLLESKAEAIIGNNKPDFYLVYTLAKFGGKLNKDYASLDSLFRKNSDVNFQLILVGLDPMQEWGLSKREIRAMLQNKP